MRITILLLIALAFFSVQNTTAQTTNYTVTDSTKNALLLKQSIIPASLIGLGIIINNSTFEKNVQTNLRNKVGNDFHFPIDDYLQYAPIVEMYTADICGVKAKNHWFDQTKNLLIANLISSTITHRLKVITQKERPNGGVHSFPSGHTTSAFTNACVLYNEFRDTAPVLAYSGFACATTTGSFRMINNAHWMSDILVGAGIGILSAELVYHIEPLKNFNPFKKSQNITMVPQFGNGNYGFYFAYKF
jgi:membrane-associated phospholipid phosphatase